MNDILENRKTDHIDICLNKKVQAKNQTTGFEDVGAMPKDEFKVRKENASFNGKDNYLLEKLLSI